MYKCMDLNEIITTYSKTNTKELIFLYFTLVNVKLCTLEMCVYLQRKFTCHWWPREFGGSLSTQPPISRKKSTRVVEFS